MPPKIVDARILLGWMGRADALRALTQEAVLDAPLTEDAAIALWESYRTKVAALGNREIPNPAYLGISFREKHMGERHIKRCRKQGARNMRLVKIDPMGLVVHQLMVTDRSDAYEKAMQSPVERIRACLGGDTHIRQLKTRDEAERTVIELPHFEFQFGIENGQLKVMEMARHITISIYCGRHVLWAGYHRTYALASQEYPDEMDRLLLAILTTDAAPLLDVDADKRALVCGPCPALFKDFFDDDLCMRIKLRKRRSELHVSKTSAKVDRVFADDET